MITREVELYFDTINDFDYDDYVGMCQREGREVYEEKSKDYKNWNKDMKLLVYRLFLSRLDKSDTAHNIVKISSKKGSFEKPLDEFLKDQFKEPSKFRFVREEQPNRLSLKVIDNNKKQTTYKITFIDENVPYEGIF